MSVSRRPVHWRLASLLVVGMSLVAAVASAQSVRVKIGPASIYERPRTTSEIIMTVPEGTVLEVLQREGQWYWVLAPRDAYGTQRPGYVPVYVVERIGDKTTAEPGIVGGLGGMVPETHEAATLAPLERFYVGVNRGGQFGSPGFSDYVTFRLYNSAGSFQSAYSVPNSDAFDATFGVRLGERVILGFCFWHTSGTANASAIASVPHPFQYNQPRTVTADGLSVSREENDGHIQLTYLVPLGRHVDLAVFGGPSVLYLRQDLISSFIFREGYSNDTVTIDGFLTERKSKAILGVHVGADLSVMVWRFFGLGVGARYTRGSMNLPSAGEGSLPVDVGGLQVSGGVRFRF